MTILRSLAFSYAHERFLERSNVMLSGALQRVRSN